MSPDQCRMARAALRISTQQLAEMSGVNATTVNNFEKGKDSYSSTVQKLKNALESTGKIRFEGDDCVCLNSDEA